MNPTRLIVSVVLIFPALLLTVPGCLEEDKSSEASGIPQSDANSDLAKQLRKVIDQSIQATNGKNAQAILATIHPDSPARKTTADALEQGLQQAPVTMELVDFHAMGGDELYAVARVKQKVIPTNPRAPREAVLEVIHIFRRDGQDWKFWATQQLDLETVERPAATQPARPPENSIIYIPPAAAGGQK
jgi:hypothetical protein